MDVPDYYEEVSLRLVRVMDTSGLGEKVRRKRNEMWIQYEQLLTVAFSLNKYTIHIFGSQAEATTTVGLRSDIDIIHRYDCYTVLQDLQSWVPGSETFLIITDDTTPAGYVKLQRVYDDTPIPVCNLQTDRLMLDRYGPSVLYNAHRSLKNNSADVHHGPANTTYHRRFYTSSDHVMAFRDRSWPHTASEWILRHRKHNWPSQETVSTIQQSGTLLVPVGQQLSPDKHLEWRISLSYGEKILVWQFNSSQYKCYVLLKMINIYFIKPKVGDNVLTSYHCKTCMFYMIESTPATLWQPQNLLICIDLCLRQLCTWVEGGNCPNYFIPAENMFLGKLNGANQRNLAHVLRDLLRQKGKYLTRIPCDGIGWKLIKLCQFPLTQIADENKDDAKSVAETVECLLVGVYCAWFDLLNESVLINPRILDRTYSSHEVRQETNTILRTFCCSSLGSHLASKCLEHDVIYQEGLDLAHELLLLGSFSDVASGKLKLAAFHLMQNNVILAENILHNIENYTFLVSNVSTEPSKHLILLRIVNENLSTTEVVRYYSACPVPYLPSEIHCTPRALIPEMFRSTGSYRASLNPLIKEWPSLAVVDPKFYLYFLEHQCYHQQNRIHQKMAALDNMIWVILLSYCLKKEGLFVQAYKVLSKSMKLKIQHNAARWQIACLINAAFRWLGARR